MVASLGNFIEARLFFGSVSDTLFVIMRGDWLVRARASVIRIRIEKEI
jgi:hypothetical protein